MLEKIQLEYEEIHHSGIWTKIIYQKKMQKFYFA